MHCKIQELAFHADENGSAASGKVERGILEVALHHSDYFSNATHSCVCVYAAPLASHLQLLDLAGVTHQQVDRTCCAPTSGTGLLDSEKQRSIGPLVE